ncbi:MAG: AI-2E family transporter, partial [Selenomonas massiliensis]
VYPALVGKSLHLHPVAVILGVVFGGELLGAAGMFLAVPFIVITDIYRDRQEMKEERMTDA